MLFSDVLFCITAHNAVKMCWKMFSSFERLKWIICRRNKLPHIYPLVIYLTKHLCVYLVVEPWDAKQNPLVSKSLYLSRCITWSFCTFLNFGSTHLFCSSIHFWSRNPGGCQRKTRRLSTMHLYDSAKLEAESQVAKRPYRLTVNPKPAHETLHSNQAVISSQAGRPCGVYIALSGVYIWGSSFREQWPLSSCTLPVAK